MARKPPRDWREAEREKLARLRDWQASLQEQRVHKIGRHFVPKIDLSRPPTPAKRKRGKGGGAKLSLSDKEIVAGQKYCRRMLKKDPTWFRRLGWEKTALDCILNVKELKHLHRKSWQTGKRLIVKPVIDERGATYWRHLSKSPRSK